MFMLPSSLNLRKEADEAFGGIAGAFQNTARPLPITLLGSSDVSFFPHSMAAAVLSIASISPDGFISAP